MTRLLDRRRLILAATFALAFAPLLIRAQAPAPGGSRAPAVAGVAPKSITLDDYARFKRIGGAAISTDGRWTLYTVTPNDGDATLFVKALDATTAYDVPRGTGASFSDNARWVGYFISPPAAGRGARGGRGGGGAAPAQADAAGAPPAARTFEVLDLTNGSKTTFPAVASFAFSPDGEWLLMRPQGATATPAAGAAAGGGRGAGAAPAADNAAAAGTDLLMRHLTTGTQRYVGNVGAYAFDDAGKLMAYTVRGQQRLGNGVYVMTLSSGDQKMLDAAAADYDQLTWSADGTNLAVLRGDKARGRVQKDNVVIAWHGVGTADMRTLLLDPAKASFPAGMVISEFAPLRWSRDGARILLGVKEQEPERPATTEPQANVDVWHWKDTEPQSVQIVRLNQDRRSTFAAVFDLDSRTVRQIADADMRTVNPTDDFRWAIGQFDAPYRGQISWGGNKADIYRVNMATGERTVIESGLTRTMGYSPDGKWFLYLKAGRVYSYEMATARKTQIDGGRNFVDVEDDHDYEKPVYGVAGFTADGKSALLYDRYDIWALPLAGGTAVNITKGEGARQEIQYRIVEIGPDAGGGGRGGRGGGGPAKPIDLTKPVSLRAVGEYTKKQGYFAMQPGQAPAPLIWADKAIGTPIVARRADRMIFTQQTFSEYPNYWLSDTRFGAPRQVTDADPELLKEFAWGTKKLIDYKNSKGQRLQATLTLPAGYEPGKKYPMLVYFYEIMSNTHHSFALPSYDDRPHMATYASNGYLVLQPDVVYEIGKPGSSALDCVGSAVRKVIELGYADATRVGLQGHSWGGYQSSFIVTQTDMFAAVVTGAPPTDLTSFYGTLYRSSGNIQQGITEVGQVRMGEGVTPWTAHALYESQSAVHNAPNIKTPFMILHGTADGAVDWMQGLEFYAAARRLGKNVILLSYPDEAHHLGRRENQKDFQIRMRQYFDHYLKGAPAPQWMTDGVPQVRKGLDPLIIAPVKRAAGLPAPAPVMTQAVDRMNPIIALQERGRPVFGIAHPSIGRGGGGGRGRAGVDPAPPPPPPPAIDLGVVAKETVDYTRADYLYTSGSSDTFLRYLEEIKKAGGSMRTHPFTAKIGIWHSNPTNVGTAIVRQLAAGHSNVSMEAVESAQEVRDVIRAMRFASAGGTRPDTDLENAAAYWGLTVEQYKRKADVWPLNKNGELLISVIIESLEGLAHVREIAAEPGVGQIFAGYGTLGGVFRGDPAGREAAAATILAACKEFKIPCGFPTNNPAEIEQRMKEGWSVFIMQRRDDAGFAAVEAGRKLAGR